MLENVSICNRFDNSTWMHPFFIFFFKAFFSYYSNIRIWVGQEPNKTKPASLIPSNFFLCFQLICRYRSSKNILKNWHKSREVLGVKGRNDDRTIEDLVKERGCPFIHLSYKTLKIIFVVWFIKYYSFLQQDSMTNKFSIHMTTRREWGGGGLEVGTSQKRGYTKKLGWVWIQRRLKERTHHENLLFAQIEPLIHCSDHG